jgi:hypothetical protein
LLNSVSENAAARIILAADRHDLLQVAAWLWFALPQGLLRPSRGVIRSPIQMIVCRSSTARWMAASSIIRFTFAQSAAPSLFDAIRLLRRSYTRWVARLADRSSDSPE